MLNIFISYSHKDEPFLEKLQTHLSPLIRNKLISIWHDRKILPGSNWDSDISNKLEESDLILLLISADFIASDYCFGVEVKRALQKNKNQDSIVIPIILRHCDWKLMQFSELQALPTDAKPICSGHWENEDLAFLNIVEGIKTIANHFILKKKVTQEKLNNKSVDLVFGTNRRKIDRYILDNATFLGIDFGTSTTVISSISISKNNQEIVSTPINISLFRDEGQNANSFLIPSVLFYEQRKKSLLFGSPAKANRDKPLTMEGVNYWSSFKMGLGQDLGNVYCDSLLSNGNYKILRPQDATKVFFEYLKNEIDNYIKMSNLNDNLKICISIPASFEANQRRELFQAVKSSGIEVGDHTFIDEPNAAFISYISQFDNDFSQDLHSTQLSLVFDFGAGTCDVSVLEFGNRHDGFYSKNISISRFEQLGGDNIDKRIAKNIIFPDFCDEFDLDEDEISEREYLDYFEPKFKPAAESLKIRISESIVKYSKKKKKLRDFNIFREETINLSFRGKNYNYEAQSITKGQFEDEMTAFITQDIRDSSDSIFYVIESALTKAKIKYSDIDNVLLVGGSCKNPIIVNAIRKAFDNAKIFAPENLQTIVSQGAAVNSLLSIGINSPPIAPVVSETISIKVAGNKYFPIIKQGEGIPHFKEITNQLIVQKEKQKAIEMPLFVSGNKKMLETIVIYADKYFTRDDVIKITSEIDNNKIVTIRVYCNGKPLNTKEISPFANELLTPYKRVIKETEREINNLRSKGLTVHDDNFKEIVETLITIHSETNNHKEAMEAIIKYFPNNHTEIAYHAHCAGFYEISTKYTKLAYKEDPSPLNAYNLALEFDKNSKEYMKYMKISSEGGYIDAQLEYIKLAKDINDKDKKNIKLEIFQSLYLLFQEGISNMSKGDIENLLDVCYSLGFKEIYTNILEQKEQIELIKSKAANELFEENNLLQEIIN